MFGRHFAGEFRPGKIMAVLTGWLTAVIKNFGQVLEELSSQ